MTRIPLYCHTVTRQCTWASAASGTGDPARPKTRRARIPTRTPAGTLKAHGVTN